MRMNRRNVLLGLGTVVASGGAALGTGAFSSVEANRTVNIDVANDSRALIGLSPGPNTNFVSGDGTGAIEVDLSNDGLGDDADGLNVDATTTIDNAIVVTNNHTERVDLSFGTDGDDGSSTTITGGNIEATFEFDGSESELTSGSETNISISINSTDASTGDSINDDSITIYAEPNPVE